ncbi:MAG TPA: bacillithiol biosynthesis cysteine-adding enzyme BshC, partial [Candidatus Hydrogenedentes bacterium]|nr:bacillithiol biosynthesis cysteine-adding enzyme BshC [Candidatus Hydrogenedentota bacterium]
SLHSLIDLAANEAPCSEQSEAVAVFLHESLDTSASLADWTARILARLFRDTPLILFAPQIPVARELAKPLFAREIDYPGATAASLAEAGERLRGLGFPQQIAKEPSECSFFLSLGHRRIKVLYEEGRFILQAERLECTREDMHDLLAAVPDRFSPNVALRCIVQQQLFPAAAYVAGPGEVAYWAQLRDLFDRFNLPMPVVYPRARCTLTSLKLSKLMRKLGLSTDTLFQPEEELLRDALRHVAESPARSVLERHRTSLETALGSLVGELAPMDANAGDMARSVSESVRARLDDIDRLLAERNCDQVEAVTRQIARLSNALAPFRKPQERVYTVFSFLFEHGWELVPRLVESLDIESFEHQEIEL